MLNPMQNDNSFNKCRKGKVMLDLKKEKRAYKRIYKSLKEMLINLTQHQNETIKAASIHLGIKYSAAKFICKQFRKKKMEGIVLKNPSHIENDSQIERNNLINLASKLNSRETNLQMIESNLKDKERIIPFSTDFHQTHETFNEGKFLLNKKNSQFHHKDFLFDFEYYFQMILEKYSLKSFLKRFSVFFANKLDFL